MQKKIEDIEILRAAAILLVVVHHARNNLFNWHSDALDRFYNYFWGATGVELFLVISGFVIARSLLPELAGQENNNLKWRVIIAFWIRRIWRLFPAAWFWLAAIVLATIFFNESGSFGSVRAAWTGAIAAIFQVANFRMLSCYGAFECGPTFVWWSLSLEEQFYFILPLLAILASRWIVLILFFMVFWQFFVGALVPLRFAGLFLGVLIAIWSNHQSYMLFRPDILKKPQYGLPIFMLLLLGLATIMSRDNHVVPVTTGYNVITLISGVLVAIASYNQNYFSPITAVKRLLLWIGSRSYGIYLIHIPCYFGTRELWYRISESHARPGEAEFYPFLLTAAASIVIFSELSYRLIENPLRRRGSVMAAKTSGAG